MIISKDDKTLKLTVTVCPIYRADAVRSLEHLDNLIRNRLITSKRSNFCTPMPPKLRCNRRARQRPHPRKDPNAQHESSRAVRHAMSTVSFRKGSDGLEGWEEEKDGGEEGDETEEDLARGEESARGEDVVEVDVDSETWDGGLGDGECCVGGAILTGSTVG